MKSRLWATVKGIARFLVVLAALYACFFYLGDFSSKQSIVLSALGCVLGLPLYDGLTALQRPAKTFSPFCVSIHPNWYRLLLDFKLIGGKDEWERLCEVMDKVPAGEYSLFRSGIMFSVIAAPTEDGLPPGLTFSNNHKGFVTKADFSESIMELESGGRLGEEHHYLKHPRWANLPEVYFKWGTDGCDLGLEVQHDWWKQLSDTGGIGELAKVKTHRDHLCGTTRLVIATLPYSEFGIYFQTNDDMMAQQEARDKQLKANGWQRQTERDSEIQDPWFRVDHKYFAVAHRDL